MNNPNDITASVYDDVFTPIKGREITDSEIALISSITPPKSNILDIGAGTGRHLLPLSELGFNMTGIDSSNGMLDELEKKLKDLSHTKIIRADVLTHDFQDDKFDLVIMMWNSFNEIALDTKSAQRLLSIFGRIVNVGGKVLINSDNPEKTEMSSANYHLDYTKANNDYKIDWKVKSFDFQNKVSVYDEKVEVNGKKIETEIKQKWWTLKEYEELAKENNFKFEVLDFPKNNEIYIVLTRL